MTGLQFAITAYAISIVALFGYALRVWMGHRAIARRQGGEA